MTCRLVLCSRQERAAAALAAGGLLEGAARGQAALPPSDPALARLDHALAAACADAAAAAAHFDTAAAHMENPAAHMEALPLMGGHAADGDMRGGPDGGRLDWAGPWVAGGGAGGEGAALWRAAAAMACLEAFQVAPSASGQPGPQPAVLL